MNQTSNDNFLHKPKFWNKDLNVTQRDHSSDKIQKRWNERNSKNVTPNSSPSTKSLFSRFTSQVENNIDQYDSLSRIAHQAENDKDQSDSVNCIVHRSENDIKYTSFVPNHELMKYVTDMNEKARHKFEEKSKNMITEYEESKHDLIRSLVKAFNHNAKLVFDFTMNNLSLNDESISDTMKEMMLHNLNELKENVLESLHAQVSKDMSDQITHLSVTHMEREEFWKRKTEEDVSQYIGMQLQETELSQSINQSNTNERHFQLISEAGGAHSHDYLQNAMYGTGNRAARDNAVKSPLDIRIRDINPSNISQLPYVLKTTVSDKTKLYAKAERYSTGR